MSWYTNAGSEDLAQMINGFAYTDTTEHQERILRILRALRPYDVVGGRKMRVGRDHDGGYIMLDDFDGVAAAYSLGVNDDVSWDLQIAARGIDVFQYDHTIEALPETNPRFHWSPIGICGSGEERGNLRALPDLIRANGHEGAELILKADIEGAEWNVFSTMGPEFFRSFRQIVCEFHGFQHVDQEPFYDRVAAACDNLAASHRVIHVHANNNTAFAIVGGVPVPACLEITFVRSADQQLVPSDEIFPTPLDMPCWPGRADYQLGRFVY